MLLYAIVLDKHWKIIIWFSNTPVITKFYTLILFFAAIFNLIFYFLNQQITVKKDLHEWDQPKNGPPPPWDPLSTIGKAPPTRPPYRYNSRYNFLLGIIQKWRHTILGIFDPLFLVCSMTYVLVSQNAKPRFSSLYQFSCEYSITWPKDFGTDKTRLQNF